MKYKQEKPVLLEKQDLQKKKGDDELMQKYKLNMPIEKRSYLIQEDKDKPPIIEINKGDIKIT
ncbi:10254_t:CDS:1, partial [Dentiscutata heterogama]